MAQDDELRTTQRGVAVRMALALVIGAAALAVALRWPGAEAPPTLDARLDAWALTELCVAAWLAAAVAGVARQRFFSSRDIDGGASASQGEGVRIGRAVIRNTLEQAVLAAPVHGALALLLTRPVPVLVALGGLFCVGRLLFWAGYRRGAAARALGFALTFYPTVMGLIVAAAAGVRLVR